MLAKANWTGCGRIAGHVTGLRGVMVRRDVVRIAAGFRARHGRRPHPSARSFRRRAVLWGLGVATLLGATSAPALGAESTLYVDGSSASCSDSGPGTATQPFCTISAAVP